LLSFLQEIIKTESSRNPEIVRTVFLNLFMFQILRIEGFAIDVICL
jgi:hypothetical protein